MESFWKHCLIQLYKTKAFEDNSPYTYVHFLIESHSDLICHPTLLSLLAAFVKVHFVKNRRCVAITHRADETAVEGQLFRHSFSFGKVCLDT